MTDGEGSLPERASDDEIEQVANRLRITLAEYPDMMLGERRVSFNSRVIRDYLSESGLLEAAGAAGDQRERDIAALMAKYGDAVRQVEGADPQDLLYLRTFGHVSL